MSLKLRIAKIERDTGDQDGERLGSIIVGSLAPKYADDGSVIPEQSGGDERTVPAFAYILKGPHAGKQVSSVDGETMGEFTARVERVVNDHE